MHLKMCVFVCLKTYTGNKSTCLNDAPPLDATVAGYLYIVMRISVVLFFHKEHVFILCLEKYVIRK